MEKLEFITIYGKKKKVTLACKDPSLADPAQAAETDINNIMKKYEKTGVITHINEAIPQFGDVSKLGDYQACLHQVMQAEQLFSELPARVRERFLNDPAQFIAFMDDEKNLEEAIKLGLAIPKPSNQTPAPQKSNDDSNDDKK